MSSNNAKKAQYDQYKDTGIEWIGEIPEHWYISKIKFNSYVKGRIGWKGLKAEEFVDNGYAYCVTGIDFSEGNIDWENCYQIGEERYKEDPYIQLKENDLLITKDGTIGKLAVVDKLPKQACLNSGIFLVRPLKEYYSRFLYFTLRSNVFQSFFDYNSRGSTIKHLYQNVFNEFVFPIPPLAEQKIITNYLNEKTSQIDRLIDIAQKKIERLQEYRTALINQVVTKGLDPNVPMKDSGIEWIGEIPEHWEIIALKYLGRLKSGAAITAEEIQGEGEYPVYGGNGVRGYNENYTHEGDYVLIGRQGALCGNINYASGKFWASEHAVVVNPRKNFNVIWMGELLRAMNLNQYSVSAAQPGLSVERVGSLHIPVPPLNEQNDIGAYLEQQKRQFDKNINLEKSKIQRLQEYRQTLISEVVTGKKKVVKNEAYEPA